MSVATLDDGLVLAEDGLWLPIDYITKVCAIVAQRRKGKTYTASVIAEELVRLGLPWVALDPTGAWWGLRSSADGLSAGLPVVVLGGKHGDAPLGEHMGAVIADLVLDHPGWYVLDLSLLETRGAERRFATDFAERLYRRKGQAGMDFPLHLFVDEADMFAPQEKEGQGDQRMLGAYQAIVRRGGLRGLGVTLITQRPALLNKSVLTQLDLLILLRLVAGQDQDAVRDSYLKRQASRAELAQVMDSMAALKIGEAWLFEPGADPKMLLRTFIRQRRTFNSSATPKPGEVRIEPSVFAEVDIQTLMAAFEEEVVKAERDDPEKLRKEIKRLERELQDEKLKALPSPAQVEIKKVTETVEVIPPWLAPKLRGNLEALQQSVEANLTAVRSSFDAIWPLVLTIEETPERTVVGTAERTEPGPISQTPSPERSRVETLVDNLEDSLAKAQTARRAGSGPGDGLTGTERKILAVLASFPEGRTINQVAIMSAISSKSKFVRNTVSAMRTKGYITPYDKEQPQAPLQITEAGRAALGEYEEIPRGRELIGWWRNRLTGTEVKLLDAYVAIYPLSMGPEQAAQRTGLDPHSKFIRNTTSKMRTLGLLVGQSHDTKANPDLMEG